MCAHVSVCLVPVGPDEAGAQPNGGGRAGEKTQGSSQRRSGFSLDSFLSVCGHRAIPEISGLLGLSDGTNPRRPLQGGERDVSWWSPEQSGEGRQRSEPGRHPPPWCLEVAMSVCWTRLWFLLRVFLPQTYPS